MNTILTETGMLERVGHTWTDVIHIIVGFWMGKVLDGLNKTVRDSRMRLDQTGC